MSSSSSPLPETSAASTAPPTVRAQIARIYPQLFGARGKLLIGGSDRSEARDRARRERLRGVLRAAARATIADPSYFPGLSDHPLFADGPPVATLPPELWAPVPPPERLVELHELWRGLDADRKQTGLFYTPAWLATCLVERVAALSPAGPVGRRRDTTPTFEDPSCGGGAFLVAAARQVIARAVARGQAQRVEDRRALVGRAARGTDTDASAITIARAALGLVCAAGASSPPSRVQRLGAGVFPGVRVADPLFEQSAGTADWVIGNPPFLDAKSRARIDLGWSPQLRERFPSLTGAFDLFVPFLLRSLELLRPSGRLGVIVPDRLLTATYAASARDALVTHTTLHEVLDLASLEAFPDASVFPVFVAATKAPPPRPHRVVRAKLDPSGELRREEAVPQSSLSISSTAPPAEAARDTSPLDALFSVHAGAVGFDAALMSKSLYDAGDDLAESVPFAVTGSIDRYALTAAPVRFLKHTYRAPRLPLTTPLSRARWAMYQASKIVVAGLARRLEATWVTSPLALGVATYALVPRPALSAEDVLAYLCIVNSSWMSEIYRARHGHRRLSGSYLTFHRRELAALPLPTLSADERRALAQLAEARIALPHEDQAAAADLDKTIDEHVRALFVVPAPTSGAEESPA